MSKHKSEDYKLQAVKYYLKNNESMDDVCEIFNCSKTSLFRQIERYRSEHKIKRNSRTSISYKIKNKLKESKHASMEYLAKKIKEKYSYFDITPQHLGKVIRDNNITRKRTKNKHYPKTRYGKETNLKFI